MPLEFNHFVYLQDVTGKKSDEDKKRAYKDRGGTQDIGWHPLKVNPWSNLLEEGELDNNSSIVSQPLINDIAEDQKEDGQALVIPEIINVDRGLVTQTRGEKANKRMMNKEALVEVKL